jgi:melibiose permease/lactose/raffinose/galactose permease
MENKIDKRNKYCFGLGTVGRDMFYTMESMFLTFYLSDVLGLEKGIFAIVSTVLLVLRVFDAVNDPLMGLIVDNTHTRWGKFKPGMLIGGLVAGVMLILMFSDMGLNGALYIVILSIVDILWDIGYGLNDISYWSMMPALSIDQKEREKIGAFARICANIGLFAVVVGIIPITELLGKATGNLKTGWFVFAIIIVALMLGFQAITLIGAKERVSVKREESTSLKEMFGVLFKNDQLMWVAASMALFMIGYMTTTTFGIYFFKYAYGDEGMYSIFAAVLGVSQLSALAVFPKFSKKVSRKKLYGISTALVAVGYIAFFLVPMNIFAIGVAAVFIFVGEAFIQVLMLMFLADTIEYGQLKLSKRNESITFSVQPFINKIGGAIGNFIVAMTLVISGIKEAENANDVTTGGLWIMKFAMMIIPLIIIAVGYFIYLTKYKIDEKMYAKMIGDLKARGDIK